MFPVAPNTYFIVKLCIRKENACQHQENMSQQCLPPPLIPDFDIAKLGYAGVYLIFLIFAPKHRLWVLVRTASAWRFQRVPTIYVLSKDKKTIKTFLLNFFMLLQLKKSMYIAWTCFRNDYINCHDSIQVIYSYYRFTFPDTQNWLQVQSRS